MTMILEGIARRQSKRAKMEALSKSFATTRHGIDGDSRGKPSLRQVTILSLDSWQQIEQQHGTAINWLVRRANLLISGITFTAEHLGNTLTIGQAVFEITKECDPCYRMDEQVNGLQKLLQPPFMAGICCRVLNDGHLAIGDPVILQSAQKQQSLFDV